MFEDNNPKGLLQSARVEKLAALFLIVASVFIAAEAINAIKNFNVSPPIAGNVISVEGEGRVTAIPDVAEVSFTVSEDADTVLVAQEAVTKKVNVALALLKDSGIEDKDIKTQTYK